MSPLASSSSPGPDLRARPRRCRARDRRPGGAVRRGDRRPTARARRPGTARRLVGRVGAGVPSRGKPAQELADHCPAGLSSCVAGHHLAHREGVEELAGCSRSFSDRTGDRTHRPSPDPHGFSHHRRAMASSELYAYPSTPFVQQLDHVVAASNHGADKRALLDDGLAGPHRSWGDAATPSTLTTSSPRATDPGRLPLLAIQHLGGKCERPEVTSCKAPASASSRARESRLSSPASPRARGSSTGLQPSPSSLHLCAG
jgi:hypothetical protein